MRIHNDKKKRETARGTESEIETCIKSGIFSFTMTTKYQEMSKGTNVFFSSKSSCYHIYPPDLLSDTMISLSLSHTHTPFSFSILLFFRDIYLIPVCNLYLSLSPGTVNVTTINLLRRETEIFALVQGGKNLTRSLIS